MAWAVLRTVAILLPLLLVVPPCLGEEPPSPAPSSSPPTRQEAATQAEALLARGDMEGLRALASRDVPDPWLVAQDLLAYGKVELAVAFARAAGQPGAQRLAAYVEARAPVPIERARHERVTAVQRALGQGKPSEGLELLGPPEQPPAGDMLGVQRELLRGECLRLLGKPVEAGAAFLEAARLAGELGWRGQEVLASHLAGVVALESGDLPTARTRLERTLARCEGFGDELRRVHVQADLATVAGDSGDYRAALAAYREVLEALRRLGDLRGQAVTLGNIANQHVTLGDPGAAEQAYREAIALHRAARDARGAGLMLGNLADLCTNQGRLPEALEALAAAQQELEPTGDRALAAWVSSRFARVHLERDEYPQAQAALERSRRELLAAGDRRSAAQILSQLAGLHALRGELAKSRASGVQALDELEALGDRASWAGALATLGASLLDLGEYGDGLARLEQALATHAGLGYKAGQAVTHARLGTAYARLGDVEQAERHLQRARALYVELGEPARATGQLVGLASLDAEHGDVARARERLELAWADAKARNDRSLVATCRKNLGRLASLEGRHEEARASLEAALAVEEELGMRRAALGSMIMLGQARAALRDVAGARETLQLAERAARSMRATHELVAALAQLARLELETGDPTRSLSWAREGRRELETLLGRLGEEEGALARQSLASVFQVGAEAAARVGDAAELFSFLESGRAGALLDALEKREVLRWKAENLSPALRAADEAATARERIARQAYERTLAQEDRQARSAAAQALDDALVEVRSVAARIQRETKRAADLYYPRACTLEEAQATLASDEALVVYGLLTTSALALVVRPSEVRIVDLGGRAPLEGACAALDLRRAEEGAAPVLARVRGALLAPLALGPEVRRVLVSPEGALCFLPWGALLDREVALSPSGSTHRLLVGEVREPGAGILALGDPDYQGTGEGGQVVYHRGRKLSSLPATRREALAVGTRTLLGKDASEDGLRAALATTPRWRAVHLACHGLIDARRPGLSSLALSRSGEGDGFLTGLEILRMSMPADLAVLSACETAQGRLVAGEGIVGLARAFMYAGSPRILCSLWKVDDEATEALMTRFYELWRGTDQVPARSVAAALREAQAHVAAQERWKHPTYWAAWVLWGLP